MGPAGYAMQYEIPLPADYDMDVIRHRPPLVGRHPAGTGGGVTRGAHPV
ncbi:DUF4865 family protein [Cryptosporangium minutisporangium]